MFYIDHINELRAELAGCFFTKSERERIEGELAVLLTARDDEGAGETEPYRESLIHRSVPS